jgi:hypothetical protein
VGESDRDTGGLAITVGAVALASDALFAVFVVVGEPFGSMNDIGIAATGVLAGALACRLSPRLASPTIVAALLGAVIAAFGSWLVVSQTTGWLLAGFASAVGFGLIGPSVIIASRALAARGVASPGLSRLGVIAGAFMTFGLTAAAPALMRVDDAATAPAWTWLTLGSGIGSFVLYPIWAIWLGRSLRAIRLPMTAAGIEQVGASSSR